MAEITPAINYIPTLQYSILVFIEGNLGSLKNQQRNGSSLTPGRP